MNGRRHTRGVEGTERVHRRSRWKGLHGKKRRMGDKEKNEETSPKEWRKEVIQTVLSF